MSTANVSASERELEQVDGSYLTTEEKSTGYISSPDLMGSASDGWGNLRYQKPESPVYMRMEQRPQIIK